MTQPTNTLYRESHKNQCAAIYEWLVMQGERGGTDNEIQAALCLSGDTERPRRGELQAAGQVVDSGMKRVTQFNRPATVWVAV